MLARHSVPLSEKNAQVRTSSSYSHNVFHSYSDDTPKSPECL